MYQDRYGLLSKISLLTGTSMLLFCILWVVEGEMLLLKAGLLGAIPLLLNLYFIPKKKYDFAALVVIFTANLSIWLYDEGVYGDTGFNYFLISILISHFVLFKSSEKAGIYFGIFMTVLTGVLIHIPGGSPRIYSRIEGLHIETLPLNYINIVLSSLVCLLAILSMVYENIKYEKLLQKALKDAEAAAEVKSQFLSNMSHELRTPLNAVVGMTRILLRDKPRDDQKEWLEVLRFSSDNLLHVINEILDFSRLDAKKLILSKAPFSLKQLLFNLDKTFRSSAEEKQLRLIIDVDSSLPRYVMGDAARLTQILNNLISNAIKFTDKGHIQVIVQNERMEDGRCLVKFSVEDTGIGIELEKQKQIFDRFAQASPETTRKYGGTGLGLSISSKLLELHGCLLSLKSEPGKGSCFYFEIPYTCGEMPQDEIMHTDNNETLLDLSNYTILVAEDNVINQLVVLNFIERWGVKAYVANNGKEAVKMAETYHPDLILMDIHMPEMDGFEATRRIRKHSDAHVNQIPILALTASTLIDSQTEFFESGMDDFMRKPFDPDILFAKLSAHLQKHPHKTVA